MAARRDPPYSWPVKPFGRMHPVRGYFNDPRISGSSHAFHFGIDISAKDGAPVYAVEAGTVHFEGGRSLSVVSDETPRTFGYWHVIPSVKHRQRVKRQLGGCHQAARGASFEGEPSQGDGNLQRPVPALPDWVALRSASTIRATVMGADYRQPSWFARSPRPMLDRLARDASDSGRACPSPHHAKCLPRKRGGLLLSVSAGARGR